MAKCMCVDGYSHITPQINYYKQFLSVNDRRPIINSPNFGLIVKTINSVAANSCFEYIVCMLCFSVFALFRTPLCLAHAPVVCLLKKRDLDHNYL